MEWHVSAFSRVGGRERNEDSFGHLEKNGIVCCVLADGAGGHGGGDVASRISVQAVLDAFAKQPEVSCTLLKDILRNANDSVLKHQEQDTAVRDMRSTLVVLLFDGAQQIAAWGHVGDSRLYMFRNGTITLRTRDHSLIQTMIDSGLAQEKDIRKHAERNILVASIGSLDAFQPSVVPMPLKLNDGDAFLLCSDGVWGMLDDIHFEQSLAGATCLQEWLDSLEKRIASQVRDGSDNYTALGVWYGEVGENMRTLRGPF